MKKSLKFFAAMCCAAMMFVFTGCSKNLEDEIIGSWKLQSTTITENIDGQSHTETETYGENEIVIYTFNEDKTFSQEITFESQTYTKSGTYSVSGDKLTFTSNGEDEPYTCTVKIDGKDMTLTYSQSYGGATITEVAQLKKV